LPLRSATPDRLIVLATHGETGLKHLLMGSTAERVVQHATCPVLTVKSFERDFIGPAPATG
jgi:nucleotide-binding universal stress UspA family protein